jgi:hypothetical protein
MPSLFNSFTESLPVAEPTPAIRHEVEDRVAALIELTREAQGQARELLDCLRIEIGVEKPGQKLKAFADLSTDDFVAEVRERRPNGASHLAPVAIAELWGLHLTGVSSRCGTSSCWRSLSTVGR